MPTLDEVVAAHDRDNLPTLYISGPMSGRPDNNFPAFNKAARKLRLFGFPVLNPADFGHSPELTWEQCMTRDLAIIGYADILITLNYWSLSRGASIEFDVADGLGKPTVPYADVQNCLIPRFFTEAEAEAITTLDEYRSLVTNAPEECEDEDEDEDDEKDEAEDVWQKNWFGIGLILDRLATPRKKESIRATA